MKIPPPPRKVKAYYIRKMIRQKMPYSYVLARLLYVVPFFVVLVLISNLFLFKRDLFQSVSESLFPLIFFVILFPFWMHVRSKYFKYKYLLENGIHVEGRIIALERVKDNDILQKIIYCYQYEGEEKSVSLKMFIHEDYSTFKLSEEVDVLMLESDLSCVVTKEFLRHIVKP